MTESSRGVGRRPRSTEGRWSNQSEAGAHGVLQPAAVEPLHHAFGLQVEGGGGAAGDPQQGADGGPEGGGKLHPPVTRDDGGDAETGNPPVEHGGGALSRRDTSQGDSFRPTSQPVDHSQEVREPMGGGEGTHQNHYERGRTTCREPESSRGGGAHGGEPCHAGRAGRSNTSPGRRWRGG